MRYSIPSHPQLFLLDVVDYREHVLFWDRFFYPQLIFLSPVWDNCDVNPFADTIWEQLWRQVDKKGVEECWPWLGAVGRDGYGKMTHGRKYFAAHIVAWRGAQGREPATRLRNICKLRTCCNPAHWLEMTATGGGLKMDDVDWLEKQYTLHYGIEFLYVVDGYEGQRYRDGHPVGRAYHSQSLKGVIALMRIDERAVIEARPVRTELCASTAPACGIDCQAGCARGYATTDECFNNGRKWPAQAEVAGARDATGQCLR